MFGIQMVTVFGLLVYLNHSLIHFPVALVYVISSDPGTVKGEVTKAAGVGVFSSVKPNVIVQEILALVTFSADLTIERSLVVAHLCNLEYN